MKEFISSFREGSISFVRVITAAVLILPIIALLEGTPANSYPFISESDGAQVTVMAASQPSIMGVYQVVDTDYGYASGFASAYASVSGEHPWIEGWPTSTAKVVYDASASAIAAAGTGTLRVGADSEGDIYAFGSKISDIGSSAWAEAWMLETMHFYSASGAPIISAFPVTVVWDVGGSINALNENAFTQFNTAVGGRQWFIGPDASNDLLDGSAYFSRTIWMNPYSTAPAWGYSWWTYDPLDLSIQASLHVDLAEGWANFMSTGQFSLIVPEGISWVSSSGIFLTENNGPGPNPDAVPEPSTVLLLALGLGGLALVRRKARE
jgi:hypothetical protein